MWLQTCGQEADAAIDRRFANPSRYQVPAPVMQRDVDCQSLLGDEHRDFPEAAVEGFFSGSAEAAP